MTGPAVVSKGWIVGQSGGKALPAEWDLADLAELASSAGHRCVYVLDLTGTDKGVMTEELRGWSAQVTGGAEGDAWRWRVTQPASFLCGRGAPGRVGGGAVSVVLLPADHEGASGPWTGLEARELLGAFEAFERVLGVPWADSLGHSAESLILSTHPRKKGGVLLDRGVPMPEVALGGALEQAWQNWRRPLTEQEQSAGHVHAFDQNAQYLGAWGTVELGTGGAPIHSSAPLFDETKAGLWRLEGLERLRVYDELLPVPWTAGAEWVTTPTMVRLLEVCEGLDVPLPVEAWIWPSRSRFLRAAAERLRDARAQAMQEERAARLAIADELDDAAFAAAIRRRVNASCVLEAVKGIYRVQTGRFGMAREASTGWARPDWGHTIRAQARVNLHRKLSGLRARPFAIATDGLLFLTDEPDGAKFAREIGLPIGEGLGQFSHDASVPAASVDGETLASGSAVALFRQVGAAARHG